MRGATDGVQCADTTSAISIHAPHAGCDVFHPVRQRVIVHISIHAPHAGCDFRGSTGDCRRGGFQSTHPMRGATWEKKMSAESRTFQSTHPRGVRLRSICTKIPPRLFQSTHPRGVRPRAGKKDSAKEIISIHAPARGATMRSSKTCRALM